MRIDAISAEAFGPFQDRRLELAPGMTVAFGHNESGKSSWFAAAIAGLCGRRISRGRPIGWRKRLKERHEPWDAGSRWKAGVELTLSNGQRYELFQDLAHGSSSLTDLSGNGSNGSSSSNGDPIDGAERWLGLNDESVQRTMFVGQADILKVVDDPGELKKFLEQAVTSHDTDTTVDQALRWLEDDRRARVGSEHVGDRPLRRAQRRYREAQDGRTKASDAHDTLCKERAKLAEATQELAVAEASVKRWSDALEWRKLCQLRERVSRATNLSRELTDTSQVAADSQFADHEVHESVQNRYQELLTARSKHESHPQSKPEMPSVADVAASPDELRELASKLEQPRPSLDPGIESELSKLLDHARHQEPAAQRAEDPSSRAGRPALLAIAALLAVAGGVLAAIGALVLGVPAIVAGVILAGVVVSSRDRRGYQRGAPASSATPDPEAAARIQELRVQRGIQERHQQEFDEARAKLTARLEQLSLRSADASRLRGLATQLDRVVVQKERLASWKRDGEVLDRELARVAKDLVQAVHLRRTGDRELPDEADVSAAGAESAYRAYQKDCKSNRDVREQRRVSEARLREVLDGETLEALEEQLATLERDAPEQPDVGLGDPERGLADAKRARDRLAESKATLAGRVAELEKNLGSVASAIEREADAQRELDAVSGLDAISKLSQQGLEAARQRVNASIAPALETRLRPWLPRITGGRYTDVQVDPDSLEVSVWSNGQPKRQARLLSHGTTEQVYLLLRLALADLLCDPHEVAPLVLDDVTVQSDQERTQAFLDLLHELSSTRQVVIFTQEQEVVDWAREHLGDRDSLVRVSV